MDGKRSRRDVIKAMGVGAAALAAPRTVLGQNRPANRPNVVLVMTDDQGYGDLACLGNPVIQTPNLDRLHGQSVRLSNFHVDPTCSPTRSSLMTGHYSSRTGVWHTIMGRSLLGRHEVSMADVFAAAGYRTGIFGKWHLGDNYPYRPEDRGFQEVLVHGGGGVGQGPDYWGNDYFDDTYRHNGQWKPFQGYCTDVFFRNAIRFIEANRSQPFFCYLPTNAPHGPYNVAEKYSKPYEEKGVPPRQAAFYGMITNIDENMGHLMRRLEGLGLAENTILIFMTDNGTSGGDSGGMRGKKGSEFDGGHRVPCFIRWPAGGLGAARDVEQLSAHIDLLPTLIALCGLESPEGVAFDGADLSPLLRGQEADWPDRTLLVHSQRIDHPQKWRKSAVMTQRWRLVNGEILNDMNADPGQTTNVADDHPEVVQRLRQAYEDWWEDLSERFDEYCPIVIGSHEENPCRLMSHDWHGPNPVWSQGAVRAGNASNGFWAIEVAQDGTYEFALRRWPLEADAPITAAIPKGKAISATKARLKIADVDLTKPIPEDAHAVTFQARLKAGQTRLQTWFTDDEGASRGAYYVYVKRLP
ncbi:MAG: arylsulfatase [Armatimonadota bacterium]